ncbi:MAG: chromate transporter [Lachnospiraceae bacterium]|nr:chromate transporter [Lachnospiraceae bacterium]
MTRNIGDASYKQETEMGIVMADWKQLFLAMCKVGCLGFGGGSALIPLLEEEMVHKRKLMSQKEYDAVVVTASMTPGALPVEIACGVGRKYGMKTMIASAAGMALPGAVMTVLLLQILANVGGSLYRGMQMAALAIMPLILLVLFDYIRDVICTGKRESTRRMGKVLLIMASVLALCGGKNIGRLMGIKAQPPVVLSTVTILGFACFLIVWTGGEYTIRRLLVPVVLIGGYLLCVVLSGWKYHMICKWAITFCMICLMGMKLIKQLLQERSDCVEKRKRGVEPSVPADGRRQDSWKQLRKELVLWGIVFVVCALPALFIAKNTGMYLIKGVYSSFLSFGGGDAYLTVADGLFVDNGMVGEDSFYNYLVPIANVLPGSILCKILVGVGYMIGDSIGRTDVAYIVAFAGLGASIAASGVVYSIGAYFYRGFEKMAFLSILQRWIGPIVAGLLCNVGLSMLHQNMVLAQQIHMSTALFVGFFLGNIVLHVLGRYVLKMGQLKVVVFSLCYTILFCGVVGL